MENNSPLYIGERPRTLITDGTHSIKHTKSDTGTVHTWTCTQCGWWTTAMDFDDGFEAGEYRAWLHVSRPDLLIASSSDILPETRKLVVAEQLPALDLHSRRR